MAMSSRHLILALAAALPLGACASLDPVTGSTDRHFGEAVAWNKAVQTINPDGTPATPDGAEPGGNGDVATGAARRYRTDQVKQVQEVQTSVSSTGGGANSGSGPR
jgi:hypothetical protein